eukprot:2213339-Rhodomonas_salina.2
MSCADVRYAAARRRDMDVETGSRMPAPLAGFRVRFSLTWVDAGDVSMVETSEEWMEVVRTPQVGLLLRRHCTPTRESNMQGTAFWP